MKIISGGQTGADLGGLEGARLAGIETGGLAPEGYRTEEGNNFDLGKIYGLVEAGAKNYNHRTIRNVIYSEGTAIFADDVHSPGTKLTINTCVDREKPFIINPTPGELRGFIEQHKIETLNIAGNRESKAPGIQKRVREIIFETLRHEKVVDDRWVE